MNASLDMDGDFCKVQSNIALPFGVFVDMTSFLDIRYGYDAGVMQTIYYCL